MKPFITGFVALIFTAFWVQIALALPADTLRVCDDLARPLISSEKSVACSGQPVVLRATGCGGTVVWSNKQTGFGLTVYPTKTTSYSAYCQKDNCKSPDAQPYTVVVNTPRTPIINASSKAICYGQWATLTMTGCPGQAIWSDGSLGSEITVSPQNTTKYTATCRVEGCVSCFAEDIIITVLGAALAINVSEQVVCAGEAVSLSAAGSCAGQIKWSDGATDQQRVVRPEATTTYSVSCQHERCAAVTSSTTVQVALPARPALVTLRSSICRGERVALSATNCAGTVKWSDGSVGTMITAQPQTTTTYTAFCERGNCRSLDAAPIVVAVAGEAPAKPVVLAEMSNKCPFTTVDLSAALQYRPAGVTFEARQAASPTAPLVQNVGAVSLGETYYIFAKNALGCQSEPATVKVALAPCSESVPVCMNNPAEVAILKAEKTIAGNYALTGKWGGSATRATWSSNGTGVFSHTELASVVYMPSEADRKAGSVTVALTTNDPDSTGPCAAMLTAVALKTALIAQPKEMIGLSKSVNSWVRLGNNKFEIEYWLKVVNLGNNGLTKIQLRDTLDSTFKNGAVIVGKPKIVVFNDKQEMVAKGWATDTAFTGQAGNYGLTVAESTELGVGETRIVSIKVQIDVGNAQDSVFYNTAHAMALDINGNLCGDISADGKLADLNGNGDPSDDSSPTPVALQSLVKDRELFVPEGFSPNGDGINDMLAIQKPAGLRVRIAIYNRWGGLIYQSEDYKNDWNGTATNRANETIPVGTYFSVLKTSDGREFSKFLTVSR